MSELSFQLGVLSLPLRRAGLDVLECEALAGLWCEGDPLFVVTA